MSEREELIEAITKALGASTADETEILAFRTETGLTRVANSQIHQNVAETNSAISVRAVVALASGTGRSSGVVAVTSDSDATSMARATSMPMPARGPRVAIQSESAITVTTIAPPRRGSGRAGRSIGSGAGARARTARPGCLPTSLERVTGSSRPPWTSYAAQASRESKNHANPRTPRHVP